MKKAIWLSFDLGFQVDYTSLYQWLDAHQAIECGDSVAFFSYETDETDIPQVIKKDLESTGIQNEPKARVYIVWRHKNAIRGRFIFGQRKSPPWAGHAPKPPTEESG